MKDGRSFKSTPVSFSSHEQGTSITMQFHRWIHDLIPRVLRSKVGEQLFFVKQLWSDFFPRRSPSRLFLFFSPCCCGSCNDDAAAWKACFFCFAAETIASENFRFAPEIRQEFAKWVVEVVVVVYRQVSRQVRIYVVHNTYVLYSTLLHFRLPYSSEFENLADFFSVIESQFFRLKFGLAV